MYRGDWLVESTQLLEEGDYPKAPPQTARAHDRLTSHANKGKQFRGEVFGTPEYLPHTTPPQSIYKDEGMRTSGSTPNA